MSSPICPVTLVGPCLTAILACCLATPARADDCARIKTGMLTAARVPHTITLTRIEGGKPVTSRMVQTKDTRYVEVNGTWHSIPFTADDVREMETSVNQSKFTCSRVGKDSLGGKDVTVYLAHIKNDETEGDAKLWLDTDGLPLKVDNIRDGEMFSSTYDFAHADPPAESTPLGTR